MNDGTNNSEQLPWQDVPRKTIAIDYDDTFTADPERWGEVIKTLSEGHDVICVSARRNTLENRSLLRSSLPNCIQIILLAYDTPKHEHAMKYGINVDIWIDDRPQGIHGHRDDFT